MYPLLVLLVAAGPLRCLAQGNLVTRAATGSLLEQAADGSWLQAVKLQAADRGLRDAFSRQLVTVECPSSQVGPADGSRCMKKARPAPI